VVTRASPVSDCRGEQFQQVPFQPVIAFIDRGRRILKKIREIEEE
jgi:hypothetical protein